MTSCGDEQSAPSEGTLDWHISKVFELAKEEVNSGSADSLEVLKSIYLSFLFRSCEHLGVEKQKVFDANEEIKQLFQSVWMEEAEQETKH